MDAVSEIVEHVVEESDHSLSEDNRIEKPKPQKRERSAAQKEAFLRCQEQRKIKIAEKQASGVTKQKHMRVSKDQIIDLQNETLEKQKALISSYEEIPTQPKKKKASKPKKKKPPTPVTSEESESESESSESEDEAPPVKKRAAKKTPQQPPPLGQPPYRIKFY